MIRCWGFTSFLKSLKYSSTCEGREINKNLPSCSCLLPSLLSSLGVPSFPQIYLPSQWLLNAVCENNFGETEGRPLVELSIGISNWTQLVSERKIKRGMEAG